MRSFDFSNIEQIPTIQFVGAGRTEMPEVMTLTFTSNCDGVKSMLRFEKYGSTFVRTLYISLI
jgi:hypothetical protein